jgi:hypothetical protein
MHVHAATNRPNLFDHARSELCQDAFLAWLCAWADPGREQLDAGLNEIGTAFIEFLYARHGAAPPPYTSVKVRTQYRGMDVLVFLQASGGEHCILIEDKVFAGFHNGQLDRYLGVLKEHQPQARVLPIHLQTTFIGHPLPSKKFRSIDLPAFVEFLQKKEWNVITDSIFISFREHLVRRHENARKFNSLPVDQWRTAQWLGFFNELRHRLAAQGYASTFEGNPRSSGPMAVLRMENALLPGGILCCAEVYGRRDPMATIRINSRNSSELDALYEILRPQAAGNGITLRPGSPARRGSTALAGMVDPSQFLTEQGFMDVDRLEHVVTVLNQLLLAQTVLAATGSLVE